MKSSKEPHFGRDLKQGQQDERRFWEISEQFYLEGSGLRLIQMDGRGRDFRVIERDSKSVLAEEYAELKTDRYTFQETKNFFIEIYSNQALKTPGGPTQALEHNNAWFIYRFKYEGDIFVFKTGELVEFLEANDKIYRKASVYNPMGSYSSLGYVVPRYGIIRDIYRHMIGPADKKETNEKQ